MPNIERLSRGSIDLALSNFEGELKLVQNRCATGNSWLAVTVIGTDGNRDGIGARLTLEIQD
jgi:hypothetical protein